MLLYRFQPTINGRHQAPRLFSYVLFTSISKYGNHKLHDEATEAVGSTMKISLKANSYASP
eukprot:6186013-Pleurochrysis_carterae.AAC.3